MTPQGARALVLVACAGAAGCAAPRDVVDRVSAASTPAHLPQVVACWEKLAETSTTRGGALAVMDFTIEGGTSKVKGARVIRTEAPSTEDGAAGPTQPELDELGRCVEAAMNRTTLPTTDDAGGPGFSGDGDVSIKNFRMAFVDASSKGRKLAGERQSHILVGPRADRCQGLYAHEPPRDASTLYAEIASEQGRARMHAGGEQDLYARAVQKLYDLQLELRARLSLDGSAEGLPLANKKRIDKALREIEANVAETAALIGCTVPDR